MPAKMVDLGYVSGSGASDATWSNYTWTARARQAGVSSLSDFLSNSSFQDSAFKQMTLLEWNRRISSTAKLSVGTAPDGFLVREGGLLNGAHFLGGGGLSKFVASGFTGKDLSKLSLILAQNGMGSLSALDTYVKKRIKDGQAAHREGEGAGAGAADGSMSVSGASLGLNCFANGIVDSAGEAVSSPFGVDRTGRASPGYHTGLDIVNSERRGSPMVAGLAGTVINANVGSVRGVTVEVDGGLMRYAYLHNESVAVRTGDTVAVGDKVSTMGDSGSPGAVHLHLMVALRSDVVQAAGESLGNVFALGNGFGSKSAPLSTGAIPTDNKTYIVVNPETFLNHRLSFQASVLAAYKSQGLIREDGMTLEPTCGPTVDALNSAGITASTNGGSTSSGNIGYGTQAVTSQQVVTAMATEEARDALMEYSHSSYYDLKRNANNVSGSSRRSAGWAGMLAAHMGNNY